MNFNKDKVDFYKKKYPAGTKLELINMDDPYRDMSAGLKGIVTFVDDACQIHCNWENGSSLALVPGVDSFSIVNEKEQSAEVNKQNSSRLNPSEDSLYSLDKMKEALGDDYSFRQTKSVDEIKRILETGEMDGNDNVAAVLEAGNLDIELMIDFGVCLNDEIITPIHLEYFCCIRTNGKWESYDEIPYEVKLDVPELEAEMFRVLDKFAKKHSLGFFTSNEQINYNEHNLESEDEQER